MNKNETIAVIIFILTTVVTVAVVFGAQQVKLSAYNYELQAVYGGHWSTHEMRFPVGKEAKILLRNTDVVTHGFLIPDFKVYVEELKAGTVIEVTFTPDKKGRFPFLCTVWCTNRHLHMRGVVIVE